MVHIPRKPYLRKRSQARKFDSGGSSSIVSESWSVQFVCSELFHAEVGLCCQEKKKKGPSCLEKDIQNFSRYCKISKFVCFIRRFFSELCEQEKHFAFQDFETTRACTVVWMVESLQPLHCSMIQHAHRQANIYD